MNKANWLTAVAAILGIIGIGLGFSWADAVAAIIISLDILYDGFKNLKGVVWDLMDASPRTVEHEQTDALPATLETELQKLPYISAVRIRLREEGHVYFGEAWVKFRWCRGHREAGSGDGRACSVSRLADAQPRSDGGGRANGRAAGPPRRAGWLYLGWCFLVGMDSKGRIPHV